MQVAPSGVTFPVQGGFVSMPVDLKPMQVTQWNLSYQRQFWTSMMFDVTYMGNRSTHIWSGYEENPVMYISGNCQPGQYALTAAGPCSNMTAANRQARSLLTLLNPTEGRYYAANTVAQLYDDARGWYQGVRFGLTKRLTGGWSTSTNYTYSKCTNEGEPGGAGDIGNAYPDTDRRHYEQQATAGRLDEQGPCVADRRHNFNLSAVLVSPGIGGGCPADADEGLADRHHLAGAQRQPDHADDDGGLRADGSAAASAAGIGRRSVSVGRPAPWAVTAALHRWRGSISGRSRRTRRVCGATRRRAISSDPASGTSTRRSHAT